MQSLSDCQGTHEKLEFYLALVDHMHDYVFKQLDLKQKNNLNLDASMINLHPQAILRVKGGQSS